MEGLKKEDRLLAHEKADVSAYPAGIHDPQKFWFATKLITTGIAYNTKASFKPHVLARSHEARGQGPARHAEPAHLGRRAHPCRDAHRQHRRRLEILRGAEGQRRGGRRRQRRRAQAGGRRPEALRRHRRLHADPREGQGRADRVRVPEGRRVGGVRARRDPQDHEEPRGRARLRRFRALEGGPGAGAEAGLHRRPPGRRAARRLSRARADQGHGLRRRKGARRTRPRTRRPSPTSSDSETFHTEQVVPGAGRFRPPRSRRSDRLRLRCPARRAPAADGACAGRHLQSRCGARCAVEPLGSAMPRVPRSRPPSCRAFSRCLSASPWPSRSASPTCADGVSSRSCSFCR